MSEATDALKYAWRDNVTDGIPASGANEPDKRAIRSGLTALSGELATIGSGLLRYATTAARDADTTKPAGSLAYVYANNGSPSDPANGFYQWSGSAWVAAPWYLAGTGIETLVAGQIDTIRLGSGEKLPETSSLSSASGGASIITSGGRPVGVSIPAGQSGANANVIPRIPFDADVAKLLTGATIRIRVKANATAGYLAATQFGGNAVRVDRQNGTTDSNEGTALPATQVGTELTRDFTYVMTGNERLVGPTMQVGANTPTGAVRSFEVTSVSWDVIDMPALTGLTGSDLAMEARLSALAPAANIFDKIAPIFQLANGALAVNDDTGRLVGAMVPAGENGQGTILQWRLPLTGRLRKMLVGKQPFILLAFDVPAGWARSHTLNMQVRDTKLNVTPIVTSNVSDSLIASARQKVYFTCLVPTGATLDDLRPYLLLNDATDAVADETIILTDAIIGYYRNESDTVQEAASTALLGDELTRAAAVEQAIATLTGTGKRVGAIVQASDYASIALALEQATALASPGALAVVELDDKTYYERSLGLIGSGQDGNWIVLRGKGMGRTTIDGSLPANTDVDTIRETSTVDFNGNQYLEKLTIAAENERYAGHIDSVRFKDDVWLLWREVEVEHRGNDAADAYHGISVWPSQHAIAIGATSGSYFGFIDCRGKGRRAAFSAHDQYDNDAEKGFANPATVEWDGGPLTGVNNADWCYRLESIGSMVMNKAILRNAPLSGEISMAVQPWLPDALEDQPADHRCWELTGSGNSPAAFRITDFGRALRITSATTGAASKVAISGTAAPILFGKTGTAGVTRVDGDAGLAGYAYGWADIQESQGVGPASDLFITSLGKRLGNRSGSPVTLTVQVDALAAVNITLNANYTAMTNAAILAIINGPLGSTAIASEYAVGEQYRPMFADEERQMKNSTGTTILRRMALAYDSEIRTVRPMTSADPFDRFAGVALEDIRPGKFGRVKNRGWIILGDVLRIGGATINLFECFGISPANPGYVVSGRTDGTGILKVVRPSLGAGLETLEVAP